MREQGFTLVEVLVCVAIIVLLIVGGVGWALSNKPFAMRSSALQFQAMVQQAKALAGTTNNGATLLVQDDGNGGYNTTLYAGRPNGSGATTLLNARANNHSEAQISEDGNAPPFAIFFSSSGHVSVARNYPTGSTLPAFPTLTREPQTCPTTNSYAFTFTSLGASDQLQLACALNIRGTPEPIMAATDSPTLTPSPTPTPSSTPTPASPTTPSPTSTPAPTPTSSPLLTPTPPATPTPAPTPATVSCASRNQRCFFITGADSGPPSKSYTGDCLSSGGGGFALTWQCTFYDSETDYGFADPPYATGYIFEIITYVDLVQCDSQSQCSDNWGGADISVDNPPHFVFGGAPCRPFFTAGNYLPVDLTVFAPVPWSATNNVPGGGPNISPGSAFGTGADRGC